MSEQFRYYSAQELLPQDTLESLSPEAIKLYVKIWHLMAKKQTDNIWISDAALSITARVDFERIPFARSELIEAGVFHVRYGKWPAENPPNICHNYKFAGGTAQPSNNDGYRDNWSVIRDRD